MSYEIRTPLNTVVGFAELFEMEHSPEDEVVFTNEIKESSSTLLKLINDILFLSRLDARMIEFKYKPTDFASIFETRCQTAVFRSQKPGVNYVYDNPYNSLIVDIDEQNLGIVIDQVVKRAVENTTSGQVRCRYDFTGEHLLIAVQDTSNGISEENLKHIFDRFTPTDEKSTGLGMSICQELVSQMGGKITVKSAVGEGTIVWISIPCASSKIDMK
jgi:signal transduction histidine kinase